MIYNKLVRDKIPAIIQADGQQATVYTLEPAAYEAALREKLQEETAEFLAANEPEELVDILEVVYALAAQLGFDQAQLEVLRQEKRAQRGGFASRLFLQEVRSL